MISSIQTSIYPISDGLPMADNTKQFDWITYIKSNLDIIFSEDTNVFVAGNLYWYPVENQPKIRMAPDVMAAIGRPKGDRSSYLQWDEDHIAPQVVFEIISPGNTPLEMLKKLRQYERYGVKEYYAYDPQTLEFAAWFEENELLRPLEEIQLANLTSPLLGIKFEWDLGNGLYLYRPDYEPFKTPVELELEKIEAYRHLEVEFERAENEKKRAENEFERAENEKKRAENEFERAENEKKRAETEFERAENEKQKADETERRAEKLAQKLKELGIDPENV